MGFDWKPRFFPWMKCVFTDPMFWISLSSSLTVCEVYILCYVMLCYMLCYVMLCYVMFYSIFTLDCLWWRAVRCNIQAWLWSFKRISKVARVRGSGYVLKEEEKRYSEMWFWIPLCWCHQLYSHHAFQAIKYAHSIMKRGFVFSWLNI